MYDMSSYFLQFLENDLFNGPWNSFFEQVMGTKHPVSLDNT
jgi:hypothetical protein